MPPKNVAGQQPHPLRSQSPSGRTYNQVQDAAQNQIVVQMQTYQNPAKPNHPHSQDRWTAIENNAMSRRILRDRDGGWKLCRDELANIEKDHENNIMTDDDAEFMRLLYQPQDSEDPHFFVRNHYLSVMDKVPGLRAELEASVTESMDFREEYERISQRIILNHENNKKIKLELSDWERKLERVMESHVDCADLKKENAISQAKIDILQTQLAALQTSAPTSESVPDPDPNPSLATKIPKVSFGRWKELVLSYVVNNQRIINIHDDKLEMVFRSHSYIQSLDFNRNAVSKTWSSSLETTSKRAEPVIAALNTWCDAMFGPIFYEQVIKVCHNINWLADSIKVDFILALSERACIEMTSQVADWNDDNWLAFLRLVEFVGYYHKAGDVQRLAPLAARLAQTTIPSRSAIVQAQLDFVSDLLTPNKRARSGLERSLVKLAGIRALRHGNYHFILDRDDLIVTDDSGSTPHRVRVLELTSYAIEIQDGHWALVINNLIEDGKAHRVTFKTTDEEEEEKIEIAMQSAIFRFQQGNEFYVEMPVEQMQ